MSLFLFENRYYDADKINSVGEVSGVGFNYVDTNSNSISLTFSDSTTAGTKRTEFYNSWNTNKTAVVDTELMNSMEQYLKRYQLTTVNMTKVPDGFTNAQDMFYQCSNLTSLTLPTDMSAVTNAQDMFFQCSNLTSLTLPTDMSAVTNVYQMFY